MTRWERIDTLFAQALDLPPEARAAFLDAACADALDLRAEVEALLAEVTDADDPFAASLTSAVSDLIVQWAGTSAVGVTSLVGTRVGHYRIEEMRGRGGMGTVYRAQRDDGLFEQTVAIKLIRRGVDTDDALRRFADERRILASLHHPNIAQLFDGGVTDDGRPYFVMEYVDGVRLTDYADAHRLGVDARLRLFRTVAEAVHYAHQHLVVHRDLKPGNIFVTEDGTVKLLDFGIAKLLDPDAEALTRTHAARPMTPAYAAPEQRDGRRVATWTDVYQLGLVLHQLLLGVLPQTAAPGMPIPRPSNRAARLAPEANAALGLTPARLQRRLRGDLDAILETALHPDPQRRYATAGQFADDVGRHLRGLPIHARGDGTAYRVGTFVRRNRTAVVMGSVVLASLVLGLIGMTWQANVAADERDRARLEAATAQSVARFTTGLFDVLDPRSTDFEQYTVASLLARGSARVETELAHQPDVQARMYFIVGKAYTGLGKADTAQMYMQKAVDLQRAHLTPPNLDLAESLHELALTHRSEGRNAEALALLTEAYDQRRALLSPPDSLLALSLNTIGLVHRDRGDLITAADWLERALAMRMALFGSVHPSVAEGQNNLGLAYMELRRFDEAEPLLRQAVDTRRALLGDHMHTVVSLNNLALLNWYLRRNDEMLALYQEAVSVTRLVLGENHPRYARYLLNLGWAYQGLGRYDEALAHISEALDLRIALHGPQHSSVAATRETLGQQYELSGNPEAAEAEYRTALAIRRASLASTHPDVSRSLRYLGLLLMTHRRLERGDEALALVLEAVALSEEAVGDGPPTRALLYALEYAGRFAHDLERLGEARPHLARALTLAYTFHPDGDRRQFDPAIRLAEIDVRQSRPDAARTHLDLADHFCTDFLDATDVCHAEVDLVRGQLALVRGDTTTGRPLLTAAADTLRARLAPDDRRTRLADRWTATLAGGGEE